jgi:hypothetical protein
MMTMTLGHRIALLVVTSLVALMMVVVGPGVSAASADSPYGSAKHSSSGDGHSDKDKKHDNNSKNYKKNKKNKKDKGAGAATPLPSPAVEAAQASLPEVAAAAGHKPSLVSPTKGSGGRKERAWR